jgi:acyl-coenzyme A synthetase/AMP-(fatty) acid ligase
LPSPTSSSPMSPSAWIVLNDAGKQKGAEATVRMLDDHVKKHLSKYKHLRGGIEVVEAIPKSPTGKVGTKLRAV